MCPSHSLKHISSSKKYKNTSRFTWPSRLTAPVVVSSRHGTQDSSRWLPRPPPVTRLPPLSSPPPRPLRLPSRTSMPPPTTRTLPISSATWLGLRPRPPHLGCPRRFQPHSIPP